MSIEFLPSNEPGDEPDRQLSRAGRSHRRVWWLAAVLLVAGATAWAVTRPSLSPRRVAAPAPAPTVHIDPACRKVPDCAVRADIPVFIDRLVRAYLPPGMHLRVHTVVAVSSLTQENLLVRRDIDAVANSVSVLIRVQRGGSGKEEIVPDPLGMGSLLLHGVNAGFVVRLQYLAPETVPPMLDKLHALIRDPRLTSSPG